MPYLAQEALLNGMENQPQIKQSIEETYKEFMDILREQDVHKFSEKIVQFQSNKQKMQHLQYRYTLQLNEHLKDQFAGKKLSIKVDKADLTDEYKLIPFQGSLGLRPFEGYVAANWQQLGVPEDIDLMDHLDKLLVKEEESVPKKDNQKEGIGLITFQNGINNEMPGLEAMGQSILNQLQNDERPLCIGIYNATKGVIHDLLGVLAGLEGNLSSTICCTHQIFSQMANKLQPINSKLMWAHFAHSEGGLIAKSLLSMTNGRLLDYFQERLLVATYGAVLPVPKKQAKTAINSYSTADSATWPRVQSYLKSLGNEANGYEIIPLTPPKSGFATITQPLAEKFANMTLAERCFFALFPLREAMVAAGIFAANAAKFYVNGGDHAFSGATYQAALETDIGNFRTDFPIYDAKQKPILGRRGR